MKHFLNLAKGEEKKGANTQASKKTMYVKVSKNITKFKLRGKKYLYTFKTTDKDMAQKLQHSLQATVNKVDIKSKKDSRNKKKK